MSNLPITTDTDVQLREFFGKFGTVTDVELIRDRVTGLYGGFATVTMSTEDEAANALKTTDGSDFQGNTIRVKI